MDYQVPKAEVAMNIAGGTRSTTQGRVYTMNSRGAANVEEPTY